jgi:hypothetical protein
VLTRHGARDCRWLDLNAGFGSQSARYPTEEPTFEKYLLQRDRQSVGWAKWLGQRREHLMRKPRVIVIASALMRLRLSRRIKQINAMLA